DRPAFMAALISDITKAVKQATKRGLTPAFRLNATSDIAWHRVPCVVDGVEYPNIMAAFPQCQFYDYTKVAKRFFETLPANYHLSFSLAETNEADARRVLAAGGNVAVVFRTPEMVAAAIAAGYLGAAVIDGDETDLRYLDPRGVVVALYAKGKAKRDRKGFVRDFPVAA